MLTEAWRCSPVMWSTASCTEGKKQCLVMVELKKLPRSSWARTETVWREKHPKLRHPAEPTNPPNPEQPPSPCAAGARRSSIRDPAASPGAAGLRLDPWDNLQHLSPGETQGMGTPWRAAEPQASSCVPNGWACPARADGSAGPPHPSSRQ